MTLSVPKPVLTHHNGAEKRPGYSVDGIKRLGQIMREARVAKGYQLDDVAAMTGYSRAHIAAFETGKRSRNEELKSVNVPLLMLLRDVLEPISPESNKIYHTWDLLKIALHSEEQSIAYWERRAGIADREKLLALARSKGWGVGDLQRYLTSGQLPTETSLEKALQMVRSLPPAEMIKVIQEGMQVLEAAHPRKNSVA